MSSATAVQTIAARGLTWSATTPAAALPRDAPPKMATVAHAFDHPGHGHSAWRKDRDYGAVRTAEVIAAAMADLAPRARAVVGMSLGGMVTFRFASPHPELVPQTIVVDVTPGTGRAVLGLTREQQGDGCPHARAPGVRCSRPCGGRGGRPVAQPPRCGCPARGRPQHPKAARQLPDGRWTWRYDLSDGAQAASMGDLWDDVSALTMPLMLVKGGASAFVTDEDLGELRRRQPGVRIEVVEGAGHAVQSDRPRGRMA
jgi:esterase